LAKLYKPTVRDITPVSAAGQTQPATAAQPTGTPQAPAPEMPAGIDQTTEIPQSPPIAEIEEIDINSLSPED